MKTEIGKQYCVTCDSACDIVDTATGNTIHTHHAGEVQSYFTAIGIDSEPSDDTAVVTEVFKSAPARRGGGGNIESDLNVGHGAADAVAAVCTLTLGDLATGGTLEDSNGQSVELEAPHKYATGTVSITDATAAGTLTIGEWSKEWEAQPGAYALGYFIPVLETETQLGGTLKLMRGEEVVYSHEFAADEEGEPWTIASVKAELEADADWPCTILGYEGEIEFHAPVPGASWNDVELVLEGDLFDNGEVYHDGMSGGGEGARTAVDVYNDILEDADCPVDVTLDEDEQGLGFTAKEYGVNDEIAITGSMFSDAAGMSGGHGDYTVAELVAAIEGGFDDITPTAGEVEGTITLTANTAGKAANAIVYTSSGCFGDETVKQGSTTRGKNAVEQTAFKIYLNGEELFGESTVVVDVVEANNANAVTSNAVWNAIQDISVETDATPTEGSTNAVSSGGVYTALRELPAPTPEPLGTTTTLKHGHVYTLAVAAATDLSALAVELYGTAELWLDYTAGSVTWTQGLWWADGSAPTLAAGKSYAIALRNDGVKLRANVQYEDDTPAQS